jgi:DNA-binding response OmpR family regulator
MIGIDNMVYKNTIKILIVEDEEIVSKMLKFYIEKYKTDKNIESNIDISQATNGWEALGMSSVENYDIILLDVMMPKLDGIEFLNNLRNIHKNLQSYVCMVAAKREEENITLFKNSGANSYILKPFKLTTLYKVLDRVFELHDNFMKKIEANEEKTVEFEDQDEFFEFDDFENEEEQQPSKPILHEEKLSAQEFLAEQDNLDYLLDTYVDLDEDVERIIGILNVDNFDEYKETLLDVTSRYSTFLNSFSHFYEIASILYMLNENINNFEIAEYEEENQELIIEVIKGILEDLDTWKQNVFVSQDVLDVFYINASIYDSCISLRGMIEAKL